jgi:peptide-methionine (S)-S-oxide reductase
MNATANDTTAVATLGGGCFWCLEAVYDDLAGVREVTSGYSGGHTANPTYEDVCRGTTGHAEVVQVHFDPEVVSFGDVLRVFFTIHDPTTRDRQGHDIGSQYRSVVFYDGEEQRRIAHEVLQEIEREGLYPDPLVTELRPLAHFYPAEGYHRDYYARNPEQAYCRAVIAPKLAKFRKQHTERLRRDPAAS